MRTSLAALLAALLAAASAAVEARVFRDLRYTQPFDGDPGSPLLDVYQPRQPGPWPVLVQVSVGPRAALGRAAPLVTARRHLLANVALGASAARRAYDAAAAMAYVARYAASYGGDPARVRVLASAAAAPALLEAIARPMDAARPAFDPAAVEWLGLPPGVPAAALDALLTSGAPRLKLALLVSGARDEDALLADPLARRWRAAGGAVDVLAVPDGVATRGLAAADDGGALAPLFDALDALAIARVVGFERLVAHDSPWPDGLDCRSGVALRRDGNQLVLRPLDAAQAERLRQSPDAAWVPRATSGAGPRGATRAEDDPRHAATGEHGATAFALVHPETGAITRVVDAPARAGTLALAAADGTVRHAVLDPAVDAPPTELMALLPSPFARERDRAWYALRRDASGCANLLRLALPGDTLPVQGLWRDADGGDQGFALAPSGRVWVAVLFGREADGAPAWRYAVGRIEHERFVTDAEGLVWWRLAGASPERVATRSGSLSIGFGAAAGDCAGAAAATARVLVELEGEAPRAWCARAPAPRRSAADDGLAPLLWSGGAGDPGWLLALGSGARAGEAEVMLFRFDGAGEPRWLAGRGPEAPELLLEFAPAGAGYLRLSLPPSCTARTARASLVADATLRRVRIALEAFSDPRCD